MAVYLGDDVAIHLSWMNRNYIFATKSDVLRYLSANVVCSDAYTQRRRLEAKGYSGILECTKLMRFAFGDSSERGTDWHFVGTGKGSGTT